MTKIWGFLDFDNTQMHTEKLSVPTVIKRFNKLYGDQIPTPLTLEVFAKNFHGQGGDVLCRNLSSYYNIDIDTTSVFEDREWAMMETFREHGVDMADQLIETIQSLEDKVIFSLTSNNKVQRCIASIRYATNGRGEELVSLFGTRMFEAGDTLKPNPKIYNNAAIQVGANKSQSFCVEDSHTGVIAGREAGLTVFGFTGFAIDKNHLKQRQLDEGAVASFNHWSEFPALLSQHFDLS